MWSCRHGPNLIGDAVLQPFEQFLILAAQRSEQVGGCLTMDRFSAMLWPARQAAGARAVTTYSSSAFLSSRRSPFGHRPRSISVVITDPMVSGSTAVRTALHETNLAISTLSPTSPLWGRSLRTRCSIRRRLS